MFYMKESQYLHQHFSFKEPLHQKSIHDILYTICLSQAEGLVLLERYCWNPPVVVYSFFHHILTTQTDHRQKIKLEDFSLILMYVITALSQQEIVMLRKEID